MQGKNSEQLQGGPVLFCFHSLSQMSYSLNSLKGGNIGEYTEHLMRTTKGDTRSLDYSSDGDFLASLNVTFTQKNPHLRPSTQILGLMFGTYKRQGLCILPLREHEHEHGLPGGHQDKNGKDKRLGSRHLCPNLQRAMVAILEARGLTARPDCTH